MVLATCFSIVEPELINSHIENLVLVHLSHELILSAPDKLDCYYAISYIIKFPTSDIAFLAF